MSRSTRRVSRILLALLLAALAATALPALASAVLVTVRVEGRERTLLAPTTVEVGAREASARSWDGLLDERMARCPANSAYQAIELAVRGNWDRSAFVGTILGERHAFSAEDYWIPYHDRTIYERWAYSEYGICDLPLRAGSVVLMQAGVSGAAPDFIPAAVPLDIARITPATGDLDVGDTLRIDVTAWTPRDILGLEDGSGRHWIILPSVAGPAVGYTVTAVGATSRTTDANGEATLTLNRAGASVKLEVSMPGSARNWSRSAITVCVEDEETVIC